MIMICEKDGIVPAPQLKGHGPSLRIVGSHDHTRRSALAPIFSFAEKIMEAPAQRPTETVHSFRRRHLAGRITLVILATIAAGGMALAIIMAS